MHISCPECKSEYDLETSQMGSDGAKIRCAVCDHVFRVALDYEEGPWVLRHPTGATVEVADVSQIQIWILERKVFDHDQVKQGTNDWIGVAEHPLLSAFFGQAHSKTLTPAEEAENAASPAAADLSFGDTIMPSPLRPFGKTDEGEQPILLTTPKKKPKPQLEILDAPPVQNPVSFSQDPNPIFTLTESAVEAKARESFADPEMGETTINGRYLLEEKLGEGGMGIVYRGTRLEDNFSVAIKMLRRDMESSRQATERFLREYKAIKAIDSDYVVEVFEYGETPYGQKYLVMEFLDGQPLDQVVKKQGPLSIEETFEVGKQLCLALEAAHNAGVIHRDLKPANVILTRPPNSALSIRVLDFGIAKMNDNTGSFATRTGAMIGTCNSMAPEQVLGQSIDARTDIYAAGVLLYYLLAGKYPFQGKTISSILYQHVHAKAKPIETVQGQSVPEQLNQVLSKCLQKERSARYKSMKQLKQELGKIGLDDDPSMEVSAASLRERLPHDDPRRLSAALRWRFRWLRREIPERVRKLMVWVPELFHGNFKAPGMERDAPGIFNYHLPVDARIRKGEVPKPVRLAAPALFRDIQAIGVMPSRKGWELGIFPVMDGRDGAQGRLGKRLTAVEDYFKAHDVEIHCSLVDLSEPYQSHDARNRLALFGALIAGSLPDAFWATKTLTPLDGDDFCDWAEIAPTPFLRAALFLLAAAGETPPIQVVKDLSANHEIFALSDPDLLCAAWVAKDTQAKDAVFQSLSLVTGQLATFRAVQQRLEHSKVGIVEATASTEDRGSLTTQKIMTLGRDLTLMAHRVFGVMTPSQRKRLKPIFRRGFIGRGLPPMLTGRLAINVRAEEKRRGFDQAWLMEPQQRDGRTSFGVWDPSGVLWGKGRYPEQAQARALSLWVKVTGQIPEPVWGHPFWLRFCELILESKPKSTLTVELNGLDLEGLPSDPLNRGVSRQISLDAGLVAWIPDGGRPSVRRYEPRRLVERVLNASLGGVEVVSMPSNSVGEMVAGRLKQLQKMVADKNTNGVPLALEVGGRLYIEKEAGFLSHGLREGLRRPRQLQVDPQAPDLNASLVIRQKSYNKNPSAADQRIYCLADVWRNDQASLTYSDSRGFVFSEIISMYRFNEHLDCTQAIFQAAPSPFVLSLTVTEQLQTKLERIVKRGRSSMTARIEGRYPKGIHLVIDGRRFNLMKPEQSKAMAKYFSDKFGERITDYLRIAQVNLSLDSEHSKALSLLHGRSLAMRQLNLRLNQRKR